MSRPDPSHRGDCLASIGKGKCSCAVRELEAKLAAAAAAERDQARAEAYMPWCPFGPYREPHNSYCICGGETEKVTWREWCENQSEGYALVKQDRDRLQAEVERLRGEFEASQHRRLCDRDRLAVEVERLQKANDEVCDELDTLQADIEEHLPRYWLDSGHDEPEEANGRETIEYAGAELRRLRTLLERAVGDLESTVERALSMSEDRRLAAVRARVNDTIETLRAALDDARDQGGTGEGGEP